MMIFNKSLALIFLCITCVFGFGEYCVEDEHCGHGEKCLIGRNARVPIKQCSLINVVLERQRPNPNTSRKCSTKYSCKWRKGERCLNGYCSYGFFGHDHFGPIG